MSYDIEDVIENAFKKAAWGATGKLKLAGEVMRKAIKLIRQLESDEEGASLIEYTVLLAILLVAVIAIIGAVGSWINTQWANLNSAI